jgi:hypothetical protein
VRKISNAEANEKLRPKNVEKAAQSSLLDDKFHGKFIKYRIT